MKKDTKELIKRANEVLSTGDKVSAPAVLRQLVSSLEDEPKDGEKWWVIALKVLAYLIGLLLAGYGTANAATLFIH